MRDQEDNSSDDIQGSEEENKQHNNSTLQIQQTRLFDICKGKPFWIWDLQQHKLEDNRTNGDCCFNHIIGLPTKEGLEKLIYVAEFLIALK